MSEEQKTPSTKNDYTKPEGSRNLFSYRSDGKAFDYEAEADWIVLRKDEKPKAEMFYVRYFLTEETKTPRPVTFVFNGGPGASSAYLHMGAIGPRRMDFTEDGLPTAPPYVLKDNGESWLAFSDLVFIDPVGTGFSRMIDEKKEKEEEKGKKDVEYWQVKRDLESLGEFMAKFLSQFNRWESPVFLAGESYGGFRVAKLAKMAQKDYGIGLAGAVLISPALEFSLLNSSDYDALPWVDTFPTMAEAAAIHGLSRKIQKGETHEAYRERAAQFALKELLPVLAAGEIYPEATRNRVLTTAADYIGLPRATVKAKSGRISIEFFVKNLLREKKKLLGLYDISQIQDDPFPDRDELGGPDPTLHTISRVFTAGINSQLREQIGLKTDRDYELLSMEVNQSWKDDTRSHSLDGLTGATDELRYGMSLNSHMEVYITHGLYDLVTPYFSTDRLAALMKLTEDQRKKLTVRHYPGGHMFYGRASSRIALFEDMKNFYKRALG
ncbi:S10 family peptidase [Spirochaeta isovalerica]|uniref:Carboxypeptidase C (Cathepsin A) n=1 Tax=Spirochaeta isovalerica TaxID=150 RepID=A0A841RAZ8_9SPIO|nr:peptidase S10 [Spirochaeta isovalerica]MBB6480531.1 carboxypeptidase C (cathepsin A) [Spirochaeta isovalerica]